MSVAIEAYWAIGSHLMSLYNARFFVIDDVKVELSTTLSG